MEKKINKVILACQKTFIFVRINKLTIKIIGDFGSTNISYYMKPKIGTMHQQFIENVAHNEEYVVIFRNKPNNLSMKHVVHDMSLIIQNRAYLRIDLKLYFVFRYSLISHIFFTKNSNCHLSNHYHSITFFNTISTIFYTFSCFKLYNP